MILVIPLSTKDIFHLATPKTTDTNGYTWGADSERVTADDLGLAGHADEVVEIGLAR